MLRMYFIMSYNGDFPLFTAAKITQDLKPAGLSVDHNSFVRLHKKDALLKLKLQFCAF